MYAVARPQVAMSVQEFMAARPSQDREEAEADFKSIDQNHDRSISLGEFRTRRVTEKPNEPSEK